ncbi:AAA family ATPase [Dorea sp.]
MGNVISIGKQDFAALIEGGYFFVDKTNFIKEWWESADDITLIARPRRFGKTLNMSMLNCFFSEKYKKRTDLFENLSIWKEEKFQKLQGTYPVLYLSFADVKQSEYQDAISKIKRIISTLYQKFEHIAGSKLLSEVQREQFRRVNPDMDDVTAQSALQDLSYYCYLYYGTKVIILLDEYDTPMQEAYIHGYWDKFTAFIRGFFNSTFKTNAYLERAVMTGITRVSKESIFSDLNNLTVITTTSERYSDCFGFTEQEVFDALEQFGMSDQKENVRKWYDGFTFGSQKDIYNPWSITNFLKGKQLKPYWASTSSNGLVSKMLQTASPEIKTKMESLISGGKIISNFDEQIVFEQLDRDEDAIWSLLLASGYLKVEDVEYKGITMEPWYHLSITNLETVSMFSNMFKGWFRISGSNYNGFVKALLQGDKEAMNYYLNEVMLATFSYFDTGKGMSDYLEPERFYHGFVLGLIIELREDYVIRSNRESGFGRYDVMLVPRKVSDRNNPAIILEFKIRNMRAEQTLEETVQSALKQIEEKKYDAELVDLGIEPEKIRHYGFAFEGKKVLIG